MDWKNFTYPMNKRSPDGIQNASAFTTARYMRMIAVVAINTLVPNDRSAERTRAIIHMANAINSRNPTTVGSPWEVPRRYETFVGGPSESVSGTMQS